MGSTIENNKRIAKNTLLLYFRMLFTMLISLYTSRVILHTLGVEDWGIYNVVGGIVMILSSVNWALSSATQRFLNYELGTGNFIKLKKVFNATFMLHLAFGLAIVILAETVGLWFLKTQIHFSPDRVGAAHWIYHFSVLCFFIGITQVPFGAIIGAHERMNVFAYLSIMEVSFKLLIVYMLTWFDFEKLKLYAVLVFIVTLISASIYRIYTYLHFQETKFMVVKEKAIYNDLFSFSAWSFLGSIVYAISTEGINILVNNFFGAAVNSAKGIAMQIEGVLRSFTGNFQSAANPQITKYFAANEKENMEKLVFRSAKFSLFMVFILALPIMIELPYILQLWLKDVPPYTYYFALFILINTLVESSSGPLFTAIQASSKIKHLEIGASLDLAFTFLFTYVFYRLHYPPQTTILVSIFFNLLFYIVKLLLIKKILGFSIKKFMLDVHIPALPVLMLSPIIPIIIHKLMPSSFLRLIVIFTSAIMVVAALIYLMGLDDVEKKIIRTYLVKFLD